MRCGTLFLVASPGVSDRHLHHSQIRHWRQWMFHGTLSEAPMVPKVPFTILNDTFAGIFCPIEVGYAQQNRSFCLIVGLNYGLLINIGGGGALALTMSMLP